MMYKLKTAHRAEGGFLCPVKRMTQKEKPKSSLLISLLCMPGNLLLFCCLVLSGSFVKGQLNTQIKGAILNENGKPLQSVTVILNGKDDYMKKVTLSDSSGVFFFSNIPAGKKYNIRFSIIGYEDFEQKNYLVKEGIVNSLMVRLNAAKNELSEVVVVGYGTKKKANVAGAISAIQAADITRTPSGSVSNILAGRLPGLIAIQPNGMPGNDKSNLTIRGFGSPLILVDGTESDLNVINSEEIESITILKDASAAIYGSRAGNGVILITTKRGKIGKPTITANSTFTAQGVTKMPTPGNSGMYATILRESWIQGGNPASTAPYSETEIQKFYNGGDPQYPNTNWFKYLLRDWAPMQNHDISVRGGNDKIKFYAFMGYLDQTTVWKKSGADYSRFNLRTNIDAVITKGLTAKIDFSTNLANGKYPSRNMAITNSIWGDLWNTYPVYPAELPDPTKISYAGGGGTGGAHITSNRSLAGYNDYKNQDIRFTFNLEYAIPFVQGLSVKGGVDYLQGYRNGKNFAKPVSFYTYDYAANVYQLAGTFGSTANLNLSRSTNRQILTQYYLNYDRLFNNKHNVTAQIIYEAIDYYNDNVQATRSNFLTPSIDQLLAGSTTGMTNSGYETQMGRSSVIGRLNYSFLNKYIFESTLRADASAKFPSNSRWGYFPSISLAWKLDQEKFIKSISSSINTLKLRMSYGVSGNDNTGNFQYLTGYQITDASTGGSYIFGSTRYPGIISTGLSNPNITWEKLNIYNIGSDFGFWNNLLYGSIDVFYRIRDGILATRAITVASSFGAQLPSENINSTNTRGFELVLGTTIKKKDFAVDISANVSWSRSKWMHYDEPAYSDIDQKRQSQQSGHWTDRTFGYKSDGLFTSQGEITNLPYNQDQRGNTTLRPGDVKYLDVNKDGIIDWRDQVEIGKGLVPNWMGGLNVSVKYKNFDLAFLFQGAFGYYTRASIPQYSTALFNNRWTEANNNRNAIIPRVGGASSNGWLSDYNLINASYLRLKNANLGYTVSSLLLQRWNIQKCRFFISGTNLLLLSKLTKYDLDPEGPSNTGGSYYPQQKNISLGVNISL